MTANLCITLHNMMPEQPSEGIHIPFHTIVLDPFRRPFTFGPNCCEIEEGSHIGLDSQEFMAGAFLGTAGAFLVMSDHRFIILTPKSGQQMLLGMAMFPRKDTHTLEVGQRGKSYLIRPGSCIVAFNFDSATPHFKTVSMFLGTGCVAANRAELCKTAQSAMAQSLMHFVHIWRSIAPYSKDSALEKTILEGKFDPEPNPHETHMEMKTPIDVPYLLSSKEGAIPIVRAYPVVQEPLVVKRQKADHSPKSPKDALRRTPTEVQ
jgi:hypothetical protein